MKLSRFFLLTGDSEVLMIEVCVVIYFLLIIEKKSKIESDFRVREKINRKFTKTIKKFKRVSYDTLLLNFRYLRKYTHTIERIREMSFLKWIFIHLAFFFFLFYTSQCLSLYTRKNAIITFSQIFFLHINKIREKGNSYVTWDRIGRRQRR